MKTHICLIIIAAVLISGCVGNGSDTSTKIGGGFLNGGGQGGGGGSSGASESIRLCNVSITDPSEMVLKLDDLPIGFSINESRMRTKDDVTNESLTHGWKKGYVAQYDMMEDFSGVVSYNSIYPLENISFTLNQTREEIANNSNLSIISAPKIGDESIAYKEIIPMGMASLIFPGVTSFVRYTIEFRKYDVFAGVSIIGFNGKVSANNTVKYARIVESRINGTTIKC